MDRLTRRATAALVLVVLALTSVSAHAQFVVGDWISVTIGPAAVRLGPSATSDVIGVAPVGLPLQVYEFRNGWYFVTLPKDPNERAARWGWLPATLVGPSAEPPPSTAVPEVASSPRPSAPVPVIVPSRARPIASQARTPSPPQTTRDDWMHRIFIGVNGGTAQPGSVTFTDTRSDPFLAETASWTAGYEVKGGSSFDVGAGVRVWRNLTAGVDVSRFEDKTPATLAGTVPHPFFFNQPRTIAGESQVLKYSERAVHLSAAWMLPALRGLQITVFGGPTVFSVTRDLVQDVQYSDSYPYDTATFSGASIQSVRLTKTGVHAGGDVAWFFTDQIGVGAVVRFARAQADVPSPANNGTLSVPLGGVQAGGGVRIRLGRRRN